MHHDVLCELLDVCCSTSACPAAERGISPGEHLLSRSCHDYQQCRNPLQRQCTRVSAQHYFEPQDALHHPACTGPPVTCCILVTSTCTQASMQLCALHTCNSSKIIRLCNHDNDRCLHAAALTAWRTAQGGCLWSGGCILQLPCSLCCRRLALLDPSLAAR
jgi:hypothetical protein